jgi:hypothetical protein
VWPGGVVVPARINKQPIQVLVIHGLDTSQQFFGQQAMKALDYWSCDRL